MTRSNTVIPWPFRRKAYREHENPGEATVQVLFGRVRLAAGDLSWEGSPGDLLVVSDARHTLEALEDAAVLRTVAKLS